MAAYREHITVSTMLGVGYGLGATFALNFTPAQGILAAWLTSLGGMLPDLDSETGRPVREMFGLLAAIAPLALVGRVIGWLGLPHDTETVMVLIIIMYLAIRYGGSSLIGAVSVHRGMFHSLPALAIAAEMAYLIYPSDLTTVKLLMALGTATGFFSHLMLDEMYSVQWAGVRIKLKKSAGTAMKMFGKPFVPNVVTYSILSVLTYAMLVDAGLIQPKEPAVILQQVDGSDVNGVDVHLGVPEMKDTPSAVVPSLRGDRGSSAGGQVSSEAQFPSPSVFDGIDAEDDEFRMPRESSRDATAPNAARRTAGDLILPPNVDPDAFNPGNR